MKIQTPFEVGEASRHLDGKLASGVAGTKATPPTNELDNTLPKKGNNFVPFRLMIINHGHQKRVVSWNRHVMHVCGTDRVHPSSPRSTRQRQDDAFLAL